MTVLSIAEAISFPFGKLSEHSSHNTALQANHSKPPISGSFGLGLTTTSSLQIVAANKEAKKPNALLDNDGDTFLKNECKADKWVILELSQVAKMDTLLISQVLLS